MTGIMRELAATPRTSGTLSSMPGVAFAGAAAFPHRSRF